MNSGINKRMKLLKYEKPLNLLLRWLFQYGFLISYF